MRLSVAASADTSITRVTPTALQYVRICVRFGDESVTFHMCVNGCECVFLCVCARAPVRACVKVCLS